MSTRFPSDRCGPGELALRRAKAGLRQASPFALAICLPALLAGCGDIAGDFGERASKPMSDQLLAEMHDKGMAPNSPILIRAFKKEAEVEVWKMRTDGHYALFKSYPICRWSGQLGPKKREGDRQVPEGFYTIAPAQMNPHSAYYLSFNVGYPNAYDQVHGYSGGDIMVHGTCSSAGCFSMTDQQIAEIYALARDAFAGGEPAIQFQSYPFHMTPENFAKYRLDPNVAFWKELKVGNDNFEVTKQEVAVGVCGGHYVFNAAPANGAAFDPNGACPPLRRDDAVALEVNAKQASDNAKVAELIASGIKPVRTLYADGGQNEHFTARWDQEHWKDVSRPEALQQSGVDVPLDKTKPQSRAKLEAEEKKAQQAAALAEQKAEAAHAYAYSEQNNMAQPATQQPQGFSWNALIGGQQPPPPQFGPQPPAPQPAAQPSSVNMAGFGHFFSPQQAQQPTLQPVVQQPVPQPVAQQPAPQPVPQPAPQQSYEPAPQQPGEQASAFGMDMSGGGGLNRLMAAAHSQPAAQPNANGMTQQANAAQPEEPSQGQGFNMNVSGGGAIGRFFGSNSQQPAPAPQPAPTPQPQQPVVANNNNSLNTSTLHQPVPSRFSTVTATNYAPAPTPAPQPAKMQQQQPAQPESQAQASADAAKAAYAQGAEQPGNTSQPVMSGVLQQGFASFTGADH
jgi:murein L,D-transpeptidase YafK